MKKTCSKCKIEKEITEFYKRTDLLKDAHTSHCKGCIRRAAHERPKANHLYKVDCPGGYYYIGSTTQGIEARRRGHFKLRKDASGTALYKHIKENSLSKEDLKYSVVKEFQDPEEMRIAERELIRKSYTDPFLLNKAIPLRNGTDMSKRFCSKCKIEKPAEEFGYIDKSHSSHQYQCKQCKAVMEKNWREANKEKVRMYNREYQEANKESLLKYREANKEKIAKRYKEYREANKEKIAKKYKEYYEANKEKILKRQKEKKLLDKQ